jgi:hypothetical protein
VTEKIKERKRELLAEQQLADELLTKSVSHYGEGMATGTPLDGIRGGRRGGLRSTVRALLVNSSILKSKRSLPKDNDPPPEVDSSLLVELPQTTSKYREELADDKELNT